MILREFFKRNLLEGGNLEIDGAQAQQIDLKVHNRGYIVPILNSLLTSIDSGFQQSVGGPLWNPKVLKSKKYLSGSSLHFFNTDIPDEEFERVKPKVGDIDTQVNKAVEPQLAQWLDSVKGSVVGNAKFLGYSRGNEQYSSLWELTDPPIKVQIDFEFVDYDDKDQPTDWAGFSHSSSWDDLSQGIKGVFHKFMITALAKLSSKDFVLRKVHKKTGKITDKPERDSMLSFAVSSKEGGGLRPKYEPVLDDTGAPIEIDGLPVLKELPPAGYEKDLGKIFQSIFDKRIDGSTLKKMLPKAWSFVGLLEIMNLILSPEEKEQVLDAFVDKIFAPGAQGLYKGDPNRDLEEKNSALNYAIKVLAITPPKNLEQMRQDYHKNYKVATEGAVGLDSPIDEADGDAAQPAVKAQLRKGMPHLRDLKAPDFLDLLDEISDGNGRFKLQNIPLNVKIDGFGGRFGKNAEGKPFMGTSRTEPRYEPGFVAYHQKKGTTDPEILGRAELFDQLFGQMMAAVNLVDSKLGKDFLVDKQVTCEVLFLPFATETEEGKLKFVGISYDKLPKGVQLALVPFRVVTASTGEELPNEQEVVKQLTGLGRNGGVMFIDNSLTQQGGLDVTEILNPIENLDALKQIVSDTAGKRDRASLQLKKEVEEKLQPIKIELEKAIDSDPNIIGKDMLGQDYEGIVINSRLGPIKVTSTQQKDIIAAKNAAKASARTERPRGESKTAVVAIGSFVGHKGHEDLFNYTVGKAKELGGDPYLFIGNAEGKDDPIPPAVKVQTWHKLYPEYASNISTVQAGGSLIQKVKHELINPLPGKPPRYDNIVIMVGEDRAGLTMPAALMKAVNKFQGYEHVKVNLAVTPRESGFSGTMLRNSLKNDPPETALAKWSKAFDVNKLGEDWILHLMDITRKGMGIAQQPTPPAVQKPVAERLSNALIRPRKPIAELSSEKLGQYKKAAGAQASAADKAGDTKKANKRFSGIVKATKKQFANDEKGVAEGAPIVVAQAPIDIRNPKKAPQPFRNQGDIVPPTKPPSTEKRGVKGRPGQRPMPDYSVEEDADRAEAQASYMQGECMILAVAINQYNPKRYPIGYIWEYNMSAGAPDMQMDDDEWQDLSPEEQQEISNDISRHSVVHAYVRDQETNEYIDARGRHKTLPNLWGRLGQTRFDEFPGSARELIDITVHGDWDEVGDQVNFKRGQPAFDSLAGPAGVKRALDYAVKYLGVVGPEQAKSPNVPQGVELVDLDTDVDQNIYTLTVDGETVSFTYWDSENNFENPNINDIYQQAKEQLGKKLSPENVKEIARAVFKSFQQGMSEGAPTMWEVCFDYGPHMSDTVKVKAGSEDEAIAKVEAAAEKRGRSIDINWVKPAEQGVAEKMLPKSAFAGSDKNKLGPAAHAKGKQKGPVKRGQFVGGSAQESKQIPVNESVERIMTTLINKIIFNEAVQNNK